MKTGPMLLAGALWLSWLALSWAALFNVVERDMLTALLWIVFLVLAGAVTAIASPTVAK